MGLFDRSRSTTNLSEFTDVDNVGLEVSDGAAIGQAGGDALVVSTDQGAIAAGERLGVEALRTGLQGLEEVTSTSRSVLEAGRAQNLATADTLRSSSRDVVELAGRVSGDVLEGAKFSQQRVADFALDALGSQERLAGDVIAAGQASEGRVVDFAGDTVAQFVSATEGLVDRVIGTVQQSGDRFVDVVQDVQARESTNTSGRLEEITKTALYVAGAIVAAVVLGSVFKGK